MQILQEFSIEQGLIFTKSEPILTRYINQSPQNARIKGFCYWSSFGFWQGKCPLSGGPAYLFPALLNALGGSSTLCFCPRRSGIPPHSDSSQEVDEIFRKGGQGDAPLGLPLPLGESGGHPHICRKE